MTTATSHKSSALPRAIKLRDAAEQIGVSEHVLKQAVRHRELRATRAGKCLVTDESSLIEWWTKCLENPSRPASTSAAAPVANPSGSSRTEPTNIAPAAAMEIAKALKRS